MEVLPPARPDPGRPAGATAAAVQAASQSATQHLDGAVAGGPGQTDATVVAGPDRPVAASGVPRPTGAMGVPRNDLPGDLLPGARRHARRADPPARAALRAGRPQTPVPAGHRRPPR